MSTQRHERSLVLLQHRRVHADGQLCAFRTRYTTPFLFQSMIKQCHFFTQCWPNSRRDPRWPEIQLPSQRHPLSTQNTPQGNAHQGTVRAHRPQHAFHGARQPGCHDAWPTTRLSDQSGDMVHVRDLRDFPGQEDFRCVLISFPLSAWMAISISDCVINCDQQTTMPRSHYGLVKVPAPLKMMSSAAVRTSPLQPSLV